MYVYIRMQMYMWCTYVNIQSPAGSFAHLCAYARTDAHVCTYISTCIFNYAYKCEYVHSLEYTHHSVHPTLIVGWGWEIFLRTSRLWGWEFSKIRVGLTLQGGVNFSRVGFGCYPFHEHENHYEAYLVTWYGRVDRTEEVPYFQLTMYVDAVVLMARRLLRRKPSVSPNV